ncbi:MAG: alpha/beta fold hydrolase [Dehalococcoidia bacterium]|nr:alpha/beta fold hydrolase [Dehalococcoidia bacterium]
MRDVLRAIDSVSPILVSRPDGQTESPVMAGGEAFAFDGTGPVTALLIHGFSGSPYEVRPLGEALSAAGVPAVGLRLPGHATAPAEMAIFDRAAWRAAVRQEIAALLDRGQRLVLIGQSMGGLLALDAAVAARNDPRILGVVTLSAPVWLVGRHWQTLFYVDRVRPPYHLGTGQTMDPTHHRRIVNYRRAPIWSFFELLALSRETRLALPSVTQPILVAQGRCDRVIPPRNAQLIYERVVSADRTLRYYRRSGHIIPLDYDATALATDILAFITRLTARISASAA